MTAPTYDPAGYGERHAEVYDRIYAGHVRFTGPAVERLADLARSGGGSVLELGIGTGRLAVPLRAAGIEVHGIEGSPSMIAQLRDRADTADIPVWQADLADFDLPERYAVIVCAVSTLFMLPDRAAQIGCMRSAARHLQPGGVVVIEAFVPDPRRYDTTGERVELRHLDDTDLHVVVSQHDQAAQTLTITHVLAGPDGIKRYPVLLRYAWPSELDLMANLAGLELAERLGSWNGRPFDSSTTDHVRLYRR